MTMNHPLVRRAVDTAVRLHTAQLRDDGRTPYIVHPLATMRRVIRATPYDHSGGLAAAAVLHDVIEDCPNGREVLVADFPRTIVDLVVEVTDDRNAVSRHDALLAKVPQMSLGAMIIKLCDRTDNISDMAGSGWSGAKKVTYASRSVKLAQAVWEAAYKRADHTIPRATVMRLALGLSAVATEATE